jgi:hypothetical protein
MCLGVCMSPMFAAFSLIRGFDGWRVAGAIGRSKHILGSSAIAPSPELWLVPKKLAVLVERMQHAPPRLTDGQVKHHCLSWWSSGYRYCDRVGRTALVLLRELLALPVAQCLQGPLPASAGQNLLTVQQKTVSGSASSCRRDASSFFGLLLEFVGQRRRLASGFERLHSLACSMRRASSQSTAARVTDQWFVEGEGDASCVEGGDLVQESNSFRCSEIDSTWRELDLAHWALRQQKMAARTKAKPSEWWAFVRVGGEMTKQNDKRHCKP